MLKDCSLKGDSRKIGPTAGVLRTTSNNCYMAILEGTSKNRVPASLVLCADS